MAESVKTIGTTKDKTMAIETRAGVLKNETPELKAHIYLQYMGKEFSTADVMKQIRQIWTKELKRSPEELRSVNVYLKPEEFAAYYGWKSSSGHAFFILFCSLQIHDPGSVMRIRQELL